MNTPPPPPSRGHSHCLSVGIVLIACAVSPSLRAQALAEFTVNATTGDLTLDSPLTVSGEGYALPSDDLAYESTAHRNALVIYGGRTLTLASGAAVSVANTDDHTAFLRVGYGSDGALVIADGASLSVGSTSRYANLLIGQGTGVTGTVSQTGGSVSVIGSFNLGVNGGTGVYTISGGSLTFDNAGAGAANQTSLISIGFNNATSAVGASSGTLNLTGGLVEVAAPHDGGSISFIIGNRAKDALAAYTGGTDGTNLAGDGDGTVNQTGGTFRIGAGATLYLSAYGNGTYNLLGGTLEIGGNSLQAQYGNDPSYTYAFNLGSGTIKVIGSSLTTSVNTTLVAGATSTIDTNGFDATLSGNLTAAGLHQIDYGGNALVKTGTGTLYFTGTSRTLDTFAVTGGAVDQSAGTTTSVEFMVGTGAGNTGAYTMNGGTLTIAPSTDTSGAAVAGSLRVGDFSGTGTFIQNSGSVTLQPNSSLNIGNQGGTGTYTLDGGTLNLDNSLLVLGRSASGKPASAGTLNINGGTLTLQNGAALINGNNMPGGAAGTGTITQTGGTLRVDGASHLYLSGYTSAGTGTYNLLGGTLEIGGSSLQARYNNSTTTYAFNLGGGSIKVIGSDLSAALDATLIGATISTINTNGLNATWSGLISGTGALTKTGTGTLTLSHTANTYSGATTVSAGTLNLTGHLLHSAVTVASGATLCGSGSAAGVTIASGATFAPGAGVGAFTVDGDLTLSTGSIILIELDGLARGSGYDYVTVASTFYFGGTLSVVLGAGVTLSAGNSFDLFDWDTSTGTFTSLSLPTLDAGLVWDVSQLYTTGTLSISSAAVPEPALASLFAGLAGVGLVLHHRRTCRRRSMMADAQPSEN